MKSFYVAKIFASCSYEITPQNMVRLFASNECYIHVEQLILTRAETPQTLLCFTHQRESLQLALHCFILSAKWTDVWSRQWKILGGVYVIIRRYFSRWIITAVRNLFHCVNVIFH